MKTTNSLPGFAFTFAATICLIGLTAFADQQARSADVSANSVVDSLNKAIQLRFHRVTPGKFGEHALIGIKDGPLIGLIDPLDAETETERETMQPAIRSGRAIVIGLLHCRFKPGRDVSLDKISGPNVFKPSAQVIETLGDSQKHSSRLFIWALNNLNDVALKGYKSAMAGEPYNARCAVYYVAVRPVTARYPVCLTCHHSAKLGDTLGAMVYLVSNHKSPKVSLFVKRIDGV